MGQVCRFALDGKHACVALIPRHSDDTSQPRTRSALGVFLVQPSGRRGRYCGLAPTGSAHF
jgi:hypothetical protein